VDDGRAELGAVVKGVLHAAHRPACGVRSLVKMDLGLTKWPKLANRGRRSFAEAYSTRLTVHPTRYRVRRELGLWTTRGGDVVRGIFNTAHSPACGVRSLVKMDLMAKISQSGEALLCRGVLHTAHRPSYKIQSSLRIGVMDHERRRRCQRHIPHGSQSSLRGS
jgi:hypothetical protein